MNPAQPLLEPSLTDGRQSATALRVQRGVMRYLRSVHDMTCFAEVPLRNGRRADVVGLGCKGEIWIVEIKSSLIDYKVDAKWPHYKEFCDRFFFCKPPELDAGIFPEAEGLMVADGHWGDIMRPAAHDPLPGARRKAMMLKLARLGADRVHALMDPETRREDLF
ncbi:MmcB family DNA repair protein [Pelagibacterium lacus]|uniref:DNA repair protein MmcB-related protein n=1 Tax=Pelagibacterium lacus TaxID=2282655 RepID=A0A369WBA8_9HYPH|nr:MmcB family DNA repair protein [Pelagibacterium lacus]RDE09371.1 DNA repair protein MmcB-related protein [Pelagibacterium lacus]